MTLLHYGAAVAYVTACFEGKDKTTAKRSAAEFMCVSVRRIEQLLKDKSSEFADLVSMLEKESNEEIQKRSLELVVANRAARLERRQRRWIQNGVVLDEMHKEAMNGERSNELEQATTRRLKLELEIEKQVAIELGQWSEKKELDLTKLSTESIIDLLKEAQKEEEGSSELD